MTWRHGRRLSHKRRTIDGLETAVRELAAEPRPE
jgi:hypothetical protein